MPKFQQRHYEAIAEVMQQAHRLAATDEETGMTNSIVELLADTFNLDNYLFDRQRFIRACVPEANVRARNA